MIINVTDPPEIPREIVRTGTWQFTVEDLLDELSNYTDISNLICEDWDNDGFLTEGYYVSDVAETSQVTQKGGVYEVQFTVTERREF